MQIRTPGALLDVLQMRRPPLRKPQTHRADRTTACLWLANPKRTNLMNGLFHPLGISTLQDYSNPALPPKALPDHQNCPKGQP
jgi:hypothetical protein